MNSGRDLTDLPQGFTGLINLKSLVLIGGLSSPTFPKQVINGMSRLTSLSFLEVDMGFSSGKDISDDLFRGLIGSLRKVNLRNCKKAKSLPVSFGELYNMEDLMIENCPKITRIPVPLISSSKLTQIELQLPSSDLVLSSAVLMSNIQKLNLGMASDLKEVPSLSRLIRLSSED